VRALWTVDHTSSLTFRYLRGSYTGTKLYCMVTEAHGREQLAHSRYTAAPGRGSNPRARDRKSDTLPLHHYVTPGIRQGCAFFVVFTARCYASAVLTVALCPSVCLSQVGVLLKRLNVGSHKQHHTIPQGL